MQSGYPLMSTPVKREIRFSPSHPLVIANIDSLDKVLDASRYSDMIEVRIDRMLENEKNITKTLEKIRNLTSGSAVPLLGTIRRSSEGGNWYKFHGSEEERFKRYQEIMPYMDAIDVECNTPNCKELIKGAHKQNCQAILSYHNFFFTDSKEDLESILRQMLKTSADMMKVVCFSKTREETFILMDFLRRHVKNGNGERPICVHSMGDIGRYTRVVFPYLGSAATYGYVKGDKQDYAPGQYRVEQLRHFFKRVPFPPKTVCLSDKEVKPVLSRVFATVGSSI